MAPKRIGWVNLTPFIFLVPVLFLVGLVLGHNVFLQKRLALMGTRTAFLVTLGEQRALIERAAHLGSQLVLREGESLAIRRELLETADLLREGRRAILYGDRNLGLPPNSPEGIRELFVGGTEPINPRLDAFLENVRYLALAAEGELTPDLPAFQDIQAVSSEWLQQSYTGVVTAYREISESEIARLQRVESWIQAAALVSLALVALLIFLPVRWLATSVREANVALVDSLTEQQEEARKATEEFDSELHRIRMRSDSIIENLAEGIIVCDRDRRVLLANPAIQEVLGTVPESRDLVEWVERFRWVDEDRNPFSLERLPVYEALGGRQPDLRIVCVQRAEEQGCVWLSISTRPLFNRQDEVDGAVMVLRDITGLKNARDHLAESQGRLHLLVDQLPAILWTTDENLRLTTTEGRGLRKLRVESDDFLGKTLFEFFGTENEDFLPIAAQRQAIAGETLSYDFVWLGRSYSVHVEPLVNGQAKGSIGIALDVTERERALKQFATARDIQAKLFPASTPGIPGFDISGATYPAESAAGDYFDYLPMAGGQLGIVIGDVSGHGVGPALLMAETRAYLRALAADEEDIGTILQRLNLFLIEDTKAERFVTMFFAQLDPLRRELRYFSAGHPSAYVMGKDGRIKSELASMSIPLGLFGTCQFHASPPISLAPGDIVLAATDGVIEAANGGDEEFGKDNLLEALRAHRAETAAEMVRELHAEARRHAGDHEQEDDITLVVMKSTA